MEELAARRQKVENAAGSVCPMWGQDLSPKHRMEIIAEINELGTPLGDRHRANRALAEQLKANKLKLESQAAQLRQQEVKLMALQRDQALLKQELDLLQQREATWKTGKAARLLQAQTERDEESFLPELRQELSQIRQQLSALAYDQDVHNTLRQQSRHKPQLKLTGRSCRSPKTVPGCFRLSLNHYMVKSPMNKKVFKSWKAIIRMSSCSGPSPF